MKFIGKLAEIKTTDVISDKFKKRVFLVNDCAPNYQQEIPFELTNLRIPLIDPFKPGDMVSVTFGISSRKGIDRKGKELFFVTLHAYKIELYGLVNATPSSGATVVIDTK